MKRFLILFLVVILMASGAGCAATRAYQVQVNGYTDPAVPVFAPGAMVCVLEDQKAQNPLLEKEVKAKIEKLLEKNHYSLAPYDQAQYFVSFAYGLGTPQTVSVGAPAWSVGVGFGTGWWGPSAAYGVYWPGWGPYYTETRPLYDRWLRLTVVDGKQHRDTGKSQALWVGEARSTGSSSDLREVLNFLLIAVFEQFGRNTGKALPATIKQKDPRVLELEQVR
ncbi:MAG: DUF4136 domain-containing protein [Desulfobaccales bacterium]